MSNTKLWEDRKRWCGLPLTFTKYSFTDDRLFRRKGLLNVVEDQINLYQVRDMRVKVTLWQRICRVGTITVVSADKTDNVLLLENICQPYEVRDLLYDTVEEACKKRKVRYTEVIDAADPLCDHDGDGIPDDIADDYEI